MCGQFAQSSCTKEIFVSIPLAQANTVLGQRSFAGGNVDSVLLYCIVLKEELSGVQLAASLSNPQTCPFLFIVKCSCSPRTLWHSNHTHA